MNDPKVMSMFNSTKALEVSPEKIRTPVATYGVPEMGTKFVRQMPQETQPSSLPIYSKSQDYPMVQGYGWATHKS